MVTLPCRFFLISALIRVGFPLRENEICPPLLDMAFVLDASGSIEEIYTEQVRWTATLTDVLPIHRDAVRLSTIQYAGYPLTEFSLNSYIDKDDVVKHLQDMTFQSGVTRTGYALKIAEDELFSKDRGARHNASKIIALFTDGLSIDDPLKPSELLRKKGVKIYVVSVSADGFIPEMQRIAGDASNVFGPDELHRLKERLLKDVEDARVCESEQETAPRPNVIIEPDFAQTTDLPDFPTTEMSTETLTTEEISSLSSSEKSSTTLHDSEVKAFQRIALHSVEATTTPMSQIEGVEKVTESAKIVTDIPTVRSQEIRVVKLPNSSRSTVPVGRVQRRRKRIRRVLRRKLKRGPGLTRVDSQSPTTTTRTNKIRKIIRKTKVRKIIPRTSSGSVLPPSGSVLPVVSSTATTAFPQFRRPSQLLPLKENIKKNAASKYDKPVAFARRQSSPVTTTKAPEIFTTSAVAKALRQTTASGIRSTTPLTRPLVASRALASKTFERNAIPISKCPLDILFVVDSSGSVGDIYAKQKEFLSELLLFIQPETQSHRVALIQFAGAKLQKTEWSFDSFHETAQLIKAFDGVRHFTGTTYIGAALELAQQLLEERRPDVRTVVVLVSDGFSQDDATRPADAIRAMRNVEFYAVSLSRLSNKNYLQQLVKDERRMAMDKDTSYFHNHLKSIFHCNN